MSGGKTDWRTIIRRIKGGKFTPIISDRVFFPGKNTLIHSWADEVRYPYPLERNLSLAQLAQFLSTTSPDELAAKENFLDYSKKYLLDSVRQERPAQGAFLDTLENELFDISFSEVAARLSYPRYEDELDNPLRILAALPIPIYITTSYYNFLEVALRAEGKEPRSEICYWHDELGDIPSVFEEDPDFQPSPAEPLVYHLHGVDTQPASLVLTEDDYLDFLVTVSQDMDVVPRRIAQALVDSSLLLLGYRLDDWNFKVLFRGLINTKRASRRLLSLSIQISPEEAEMRNLDSRREVEEYLQRYFDKANFEIYWGQPHGFTRELWQQWTG